MNTLKKFSVETHKGWASFQGWIKKWNKIMAVIFSALGITLLLATVIVNALEVHEENQELLRRRNENSRLNLLEACESVQRKSCLLHCNAGISTDISEELNYHWETNPHCQSTGGMSIKISSTVQFPKFTIPADWLNENLKLKELHIDLENIFVIYENAFAGEAFKSMQKLVLINLHLHTMDTMVLQKLFVEHHYKHLTIWKDSLAQPIADATTVELHTDSTVYSETEAKHQIHETNSDVTEWFPQALIISLTIVCCILSFSLGLIIRHNHFKQKLILNKVDKADDDMIFVIENSSTCFKESVVMQNRN